MKATDLEGNPINVDKLSDIQSILLEQVGNINMDEIKKHNGGYFIWAFIPESNKIVLKSWLNTQESWKYLLNSLNQVINQSSGGEAELVLRKKEF